MERKGIKKWYSVKERMKAKKQTPTNYCMFPHRIPTHAHRQHKLKIDEPK